MDWFRYDIDLRDERFNSTRTIVSVYFSAFQHSAAFRGKVTTQSEFFPSTFLYPLTSKNALKFSFFKKKLDGDEIF